MNRKNRNIDRFLKSPLPDPDVPVNDGWSDMEKMLAGESVQPDSSVDAGSQSLWNSIVSIKGISILVVSVLTISGIVLWHSLQKDSFVANNKAKENTSLSEALKNERIKAALPEINSDNNKTKSSYSGLPKDSLSFTADEKFDTSYDICKERLIQNEHTILADKSRGSLESKLSNKSDTGKSGFFSELGESHLSSKEEGRIGIDNNQNNSIKRNQNLLKDSENLENVKALASQNNTKILEKAGSNIVVINLLTPLPFRNSPYVLNLKDRIKPIVSIQSSPTENRKTSRSFFDNLSFGPEWNVNITDYKSRYIFPGSDTVSHPIRIAIPGVFVSKSWRRHQITAVFTPLHSYFGKNQKIDSKVDSTLVIDSTQITMIHRYQDSRLIKTSGMNLQLQYGYNIYPWFNVNLGVGYATFKKALLKREVWDNLGSTRIESIETVKKSDQMTDYLKSNQWTFRAGFHFSHPQILAGRLQAGYNTWTPLGNLSQNKVYKSISINNQIYLRLLVR